MSTTSLLEEHYGMKLSESMEAAESPNSTKHLRCLLQLAALRIQESLLCRPDWPQDMDIAITVNKKETEDGYLPCVLIHSAL
jgi:hypothetical protein